MSETFYYSWTEDRVAALSNLIAEGLSASQIARELGGGLTRNAVIGKAHRLGIRQGVRTPQEKRATALPGGKPALLPSRPAAREPAPTFAKAPIAKKPAPTISPAATLQPPKAQAPSRSGVRFLDRTFDQCARPLWPDGRAPDVARMMVCGAPTITRDDGGPSSWCADCARRIFVRPRPAARPALRREFGPHLLARHQAEADERAIRMAGAR